MTEEQRQWLIEVVNVVILRHTSFMVGLDRVLARKIVDKLIDEFSKENT